MPAQDFSIKLTHIRHSQGYAHLDVASYLEQSDLILVKTTQPPPQRLSHHLPLPLLVLLRLPLRGLPIKPTSINPASLHNQFRIPCQRLQHIPATRLPKVGSPSASNRSVPILTGLHRTTVTTGGATPTTGMTGSSISTISCKVMSVSLRSDADLVIH